MEADVLFTPDRQTTSWIIDKQTCRIQSSDPKIAEQVGSWSLATLVGRCLVGPTRIFSIPRPKWRWALKTLGIDLPQKKTNRVISGLKTSRQNFKKVAEGPSQKKLKAIGAQISSKTPKNHGPMTIVVLKPNFILKMDQGRCGESKAMARGGGDR